MENNNDTKNKEGENTTQNNQGDSEQLTKKEKYELKRQAKQDAKNKEYKNKKIKKVLKWVIWIIVIVAIFYGIIILAKKSEESRPGESFPIVSRDHIRVGSEHEAYNSNPPTSGPHYPSPARWGVYSEELPDEQVLHNLEHGGIWISYTNLDEESITELENIASGFRSSVVLSPRSANDSNIALASWGRLLKIDNVDENTIREFIAKNINKSPEQLAR